MDHTDRSERTVLVTGVSSGIGLETALHLAELGYRVVGTVRTPDKVETVEKAAADAGVDVAVEVLDVTDEAACERVVRAAAPWAVVNNAGYMNVGLIEDVPLDTARRQLEAMLLAPARLAYLAVPGMRERGGGRILNVSSVAGQTSGPMVGWYVTVKNALTALTHAMRPELAPDGIKVVLVEPGGLQTNIWRNAEDDLLGRRAASRAPESYDRALRILRTLEPHMGHPRAMARTIGAALTADRPRAVYRVGLDAHVLAVAEAVVPRPLKDLVLKLVLSLPVTSR